MCCCSHHHPSFEFPALIESRPSVGGRRLITKWKGVERGEKKDFSKVNQQLSVFFPQFGKMFFSSFLRVEGKWPLVLKRLLHLSCLVLVLLYWPPKETRRGPPSHPRPTHTHTHTHCLCITNIYTHTHTKLTETNTRIHTQVYNGHFQQLKVYSRGYIYVPFAADVIYVWQPLFFSSFFVKNSPSKTQKRPPYFSLCPFFFFFFFFLTSQPMITSVKSLDTAQKIYTRRET